MNNPNGKKKKVSTKWDDSPLSPNCVTIFGAGIAGLTAAHELVERGFQVQVWEKETDQRRPERGCDVGGMARTQWGAAAWPLTRKLGALPDAPGWGGREVQKIGQISYRFYMRWNLGDLRVNGQARGSASRLAEVTGGALATLQTLQTGLGPLSADRFQIRAAVRAYGVTELSPTERQRRVNLCLGNLNEALGSLGDLGLPVKDAKSKDSQALTHSFTLRGTLAGKRLALRVDLSIESSDNGDWSDITVDLQDLKTGTVHPVLSARRHWAPQTPDSNGLGAKEDLAAVLAEAGAPNDRAEQTTVYVEAAARWKMSDTELGECIDSAMDMFAALNESVKDALRKKREQDENQAHKEMRTAAGGQDAKPNASPYPYVIEVGKIRFVLVALDSFPYQSYEEVPENIDLVIGFRIRQRWIPGEHGYRFFPSCYHHIFDTMKRTPLLDVSTKSDYVVAQERAAGVTHPESLEYVETGRTAFDNLHPTSSHVLAFGSGQRPSQLSRYPIRSLEELREYVSIIFGSPESGGFDLDPRDVARLTLKVLQFATSCERRRQSYEDESWWSYVGADTMSEPARDLLKKWPRALVAMSAEESDARTHGVMFIQLLLDQVRQAGQDSYRDGTLKGPTTEAWLIPWRRYLEAQGVEFIHGEITGFRVVKVEDDDPKAVGVTRVWPTVSCRDPRYLELGQPEILPGYFILAVSADAARSLARQYCEAVHSDCPAEKSDFIKTCKVGDVDDLEKALEAPQPEGDFRHFAGIQFYFAEDVYWIDGHVYYPESEWGLTSISQARFWQDKMDWEHGYRGILSAIIGKWNQPGKNKKTAWECSPEELAQEVWEQIRHSIEGRRSRPEDAFGPFANRTPWDGRLPDPIFWHLDQNLTRKPGVKASEGYQNASPFLIARRGRFQHRPGNLRQGYTVEHGFVFAGYYTQTYTRVPSMEAANESGRHAVNAIIRHIHEKSIKPDKKEGYLFRRSYCDIWSPEDREIDDLQFLRDLDEELVNRGLPHVMELFELDYLAEHLLRGGKNDPLDPLALLSRLRGLYRQSSQRRGGSHE